jgi:hypothetical protein
MRYHCTCTTDLHELIGQDGDNGFEYGPLSSALKRGEELVLEESSFLGLVMVAKINHILHSMLFIVETEETLHAPSGFKLVLH